MKRWYAILTGTSLAAALCGASIAATTGADFAVRSALGRGMIALAVVGALACAFLRPRVTQTDAMAVEAGQFGDAERAKCTFSDVAANDEALRSLKQLRDYLTHPEKYARFGARMPKGVLLYGPPGTGKTLLARALAGEAGVPFFALSGSDFVEKYVGVGARRVRDLFKKARKAGKCVIFIDEIDAMGKNRGEGSSDERDQTLNALLSEMSGFGAGEGVIVLAATNRMETLDPALLRPGRFDRHIEVALPGRKERRSILELHSRNKPLADDVDLDRLAAETAYFSGASLENLLNEAAILAAERSEDEIGAKDVHAALVRCAVGEDRESMATEAERRVIAIHEAGHAVALRLLVPESRLKRVSILPAGRGAAGYNLAVPQERVMMSKRELENQICVLLAGRAAEVLAGGDDALTAGAASDLTRATEAAAAMVTEWGMAGEPAVALKTLQKSCGGVSGAADACRRLLDTLFERTKVLLAQQADALVRLTDALILQETLTGEEAEVILGDLSNESAKTTNED